MEWLTRSIRVAPVRARNVATARAISWATSTFDRSLP
jgi:hypothetical protein